MTVKGDATPPIIATEAMLRAVNAAHRDLPANDWIDDLKHLQCTLDALAPFLRSAVATGEPVAWVDVHDRTCLYYEKPPQGDVDPLYRLSPQTKPPHCKSRTPQCLSPECDCASSNPQPVAWRHRLFDEELQRWGDWQLSGGRPVPPDVKVTHWGARIAQEPLFTLSAIQRKDADGR